MQNKKSVICECCWSLQENNGKRSRYFINFPFDFARFHFFYWNSFLDNFADFGSYQGILEISCISILFIRWAHILWIESFPLFPTKWNNFLSAFFYLPRIRFIVFIIILLLVLDASIDAAPMQNEDKRSHDNNLDVPAVCR